jgi:hypothetical protein
MGRWLLRFDGTFSTGSRFAVAALVIAGFGFGFVARSVAGGTSGAAGPVAQGRIEADLPARAAERRPALRAAAALPGLAPRPRRAARHRPRPQAKPEPAVTAEPVSTPLATPTPSATPAATVVPPPPARPTPPAPRPTPAGTTFDSSG